MKLRRRDRHAKVHLQSGDLPMIIGLGPGFTFDSSADEARQLAVDLIEALEQVAEGGGRC